MVPWLRSKLEPLLANSDDFSLQHIPCISLKELSGGAGEYSLISTNLPSEPAYGYGKSVIIIATPLHQQAEEHGWPHSGWVPDRASLGPGGSRSRNDPWKRQAMGDSAYEHSSVQSFDGYGDSVTADDSISNVLAGR